MKQGNAHYFVPVDQVEWIDVADNYLRLHVGRKVHFYRGTLNAAEEELDSSRFIRIHRSVIVAIDRIKSVRSGESGGHLIELADGVELRSSRPYSDVVNALLR